ncbi:MAG: DinB family protein [Dehalococcoidia bacterium]
MDAITFVRSSVQGLHQVMLEEMKVLTQEHLKWRPQPGANPIGYIFLHFMRTEDGLVNRMQGQPSIWEAEKWQERLNLAVDFDRAIGEQGIDDASQVPLADAMAYAQQVIDGTTAFLDTLDDDKLDVAPDPERPRRTIGVNLRAFVLSHGWWHLGEIKYLKGLQGMPSPV